MTKISISFQQPVCSGAMSKEQKVNLNSQIVHLLGEVPKIDEYLLSP